MFGKLGAWLARLTCGLCCGRLGRCAGRTRRERCERRCAKCGRRCDRCHSSSGCSVAPSDAAAKPRERLLPLPCSSTPCSAACSAPCSSAACSAPCSSAPPYPPAAACAAACGPCLPVTIELSDCRDATGVLHGLPPPLDDAEAVACTAPTVTRLLAHNCPRITRLPDLSCRAFGALETLRLSHLTLPRFDAALPPGLRELSVRYCVVAEFVPAGALPPALAELDLSHNSLAAIPAAVRAAYALRSAQGWPLRVLLGHNAMWYTEFSDLRPAAVTPAVVDELAWAHRLGLVSTRRIAAAAARLAAKGEPRAAAVLDGALRRQLRAREADGPQSTHANRENVHLSSVGASAARAAAWVRDATIGIAAPTPGALLRRLREEHGFGHDALEQAEEACGGDAVHGALQLSFHGLLWRVVAIAERHDAAPGVLAVLEEELRLGAGTCFTGRMCRLLNALGGFVPEVCVGISSAEELRNAVLARRRAAVERHGDDTAAYLEAVVPEVWQLLEDACVPEPEHGAWLEAL